MVDLACAFEKVLPQALQDKLQGMLKIWKQEIR